MNRADPASTPLLAEPRAAVTTLLAGLICLSAVAIDITLVALPSMAAALGGEPARGGLVVTAYLTGFAPGQLIWGLLADRYGRRPAVLISLVGFVLATVACALAPSFTALLGARIVQGLAGGAGPVLSRTIARDMAADAAGARLLALLMAVLGAAPFLAPLLGAGLLVLVSWRSIFWVTAAYGGILFGLALIHLPESRPGTHDESPRLAARTISLIRSRDFRFGLALVALPFAGFHTLLAVYPAVAMVEWGLPEMRFAALFAATAACFVLGSIISRQLVMRIGLRRLMFAAAVECLTGAVLTWIGHGGMHTLLWTSIGASLYVLGTGQMLPLATALALRDAHTAGGWATAVLGLVQIGGGAAVSYFATVSGRPASSLIVTLVLCALGTMATMAALRSRMLHMERGAAST